MMVSLRLARMCCRCKASGELKHIRTLADTASHTHKALDVKGSAMKAERPPVMTSADALLPHV